MIMNVAVFTCHDNVAVLTILKCHDNVTVFTCHDNVAGPGQAVTEGHFCCIFPSTPALFKAE